MGRTLRSRDETVQVPDYILHLAEVVDKCLNKSSWYPRKSRVRSAVLRGDRHNTDRLHRLTKNIRKAHLTPEHYIDLAITYLASSDDASSTISLANLCKDEIAEVLRESRWSSIYGAKGTYGELTTRSEEEDLSDKIFENIEFMKTMFTHWNMADWYYVTLSYRNQLHPVVLYAVGELRKGIDMGWIEIEGWTPAEIRQAYERACHDEELVDSAEWAWLHSF